MHKLTRRAGTAMTAGGAWLATRHMRRARGVTMIEYVLLIAIAVVLAWILREQLTSMFQGILADIRKALGTT